MSNLSCAGVCAFCLVLSSILKVLVLVNPSPKRDFPFCLAASGWTASTWPALLEGFWAGLEILPFIVYLGSSGVEPCLLTVYKDLSLELALLLAFCFSGISLTFSNELSFCEDFDAMRLEKKLFEGSRACCFGEDLSGEGGNSGMAVIRGEVGPFRLVTLLSTSCMFVICMIDGVDLSMVGEAGADRGERRECSERGLRVA